MKRMQVTISEEGQGILHFFKKKSQSSSSIINAALEMYYREYVRSVISPKIPAVTMDGDLIPGTFDHLKGNEVRVVPDSVIRTPKGDIDIPGVQVASDLPKDPESERKAREKMEHAPVSEGVEDVTVVME